MCDPVPPGFPPPCLNAPCVVSSRSSSSHVPQNSTLDQLLFFLHLLFLGALPCSQYSNHGVGDDPPKCLSLAMSYRQDHLFGCCGCWREINQSCLNLNSWFLVFFKILFIFFSKRVREGEGEGDKHLLVAFHTPPTGDLAHNPGMCPDWESKWRPFGSQTGIQSTKPHQPWQNS